ncbi:DUF1310 family protein [Streptococcus sanguinis]|uniref:DUF1310 family protein n=1 Tax=Streptococcus sanguinis TaxID=1305 RepID=UPI000F663009|nr:DUF1310 family protein [Streptococcus sanguinis]MBZ2066261.1 DUF1310 domain-containing protein [Streptococcus sanguinis]RSI21179.1 hypothetical protein D8884_02450 [Streptococcus sanguinis]
MKKDFVIFLSIITISSAMFLGGCSIVKSQSEKEEMIQIAESKKMKSVIEIFLKKLDPKALTPEGKIKSYEIQEYKLEYNPMGGIMIQMFINGDKNLSLSVTVVEDSTTGNYEIATNSRSRKLSDLLAK